MANEILIAVKILNMPFFLFPSNHKIKISALLFGKKNLKFYFFFFLKINSSFSLIELFFF